jgi:hypothetical protein
LILDNHSAHISKETKAWLAQQPPGRSVLRHIRVASKQELKDRIMATMDDINQHPVVHTWSYKLDKAA